MSRFHFGNPSFLLTPEEIKIVQEYRAIRLAPGQSRPVKFRIGATFLNLTSLNFTIKYKEDGAQDRHSLGVSLPFNLVDHCCKPQKYT